MSFVLNLPPSMVAKAAKEGENEEGEMKKSREDYKKMKELEEARKAGSVPAMKDEQGRDINPHIPQYIMQAPWYYGAMQPTLSHQRVQEATKKSVSMDAWYKKGVKKGAVATKFRKGACENCGAMTHKKKDCLERPRKIGAKYSGELIAPDEYLQPKLDFDYECKRDRWNGYDPETHKQVIEDFAKLEEAKKHLKSERLEKTLQEGDQEEIKERLQGGSDDEDEDKYAEDADMPGQKFESKQRITVRNLRIREDTAKYLHNLDVNSAYYDPKTRSMRENPFASQGKDDIDVPYAGDNFVRMSGDARNIALRQTFAWEAYEKGAEVHLQADPTKLELLTKEYLKKKNEFKDDHKQSILDKYGGVEHLEAPPKQLLLAQTEDYVEYSRHGQVLKGQERATVKSRYEEDVYTGNHASVWGSYWKDGQWGYKCCHSTVKGSYCTGETGKQLNENETPASLFKTEDEPVESEKTLVELHQEKISQELSKGQKKREKKRKKKQQMKRKQKKTKKKESSSSSSSSDSSSDSSSESEDEEAVREKKIQQAMKDLEDQSKAADRLLGMDERKRPFNSMFEAREPTEEEMEAFRRKQKRTDDPMANFLSR